MEREQHTSSTSLDDYMMMMMTRELFDKARHTSLQSRQDTQNKINNVLFARDNVRDDPAVVPLIHHVGLGIISGSGSLGAPVVKFDFDPKGSNTFSPNPSTTFVVPPEIVFNEMPEGLYWPEFSTAAYPTFAEYVSAQNGWFPDRMAEIGPHVIAGVSLDTVC